MDVPWARGTPEHITSGYRRDAYDYNLLAAHHSRRDGGASSAQHPDTRLCILVLIDRVVPKQSFVALCARQLLCLGCLRSKSYIAPEEVLRLHYR